MLSISTVQVEACHDQPLCMTKDRGKNRAKRRAGASRAAARKSIFSHGAKEEHACLNTL
jgi:hypothetical protein